VNLLINVVKAFGLVFGAYLLLLVGFWLILCWESGRIVRISDFGWKVEGPGHIRDALLGLFLFLLLPFAIALGALYLPSEGRTYVAVGALFLILGIWIWFADQIGDVHR
jgi:hypothetical protein